MSFGSQYNLNQRITYLEYLFNNLPPFPPTSTLAEVLTAGSSGNTGQTITLSDAGVSSTYSGTSINSDSNFDLNANGGGILNLSSGDNTFITAGGDINLNCDPTGNVYINGSPYPPASVAIANTLSITASSSNVSYPMVFGNDTAGVLTAFDNSSLTYNPSQKLLSIDFPSGALQRAYFSSQNMRIGSSVGTIGTTESYSNVYAGGASFESFTLNTSYGTSILQLTNANSTSTINQGVPAIMLKKNGRAPLLNDKVGQIFFASNNGVGNSYIDIANITGVVSNNITPISGKLDFNANNATTPILMFSMDGNSLINTSFRQLNMSNQTISNASTITGTGTLSLNTTGTFGSSISLNPSTGDLSLSSAGGGILLTAGNGDAGFSGITLSSPEGDIALNTGAAFSITSNARITSTVGYQGKIYHTDQPTTNLTYYLTFVQSGGVSGFYDPAFDSATLTYNPSTNLLFVAGLQLSGSTNTGTLSAGILTLGCNESSGRQFQVSMTSNITGLTCSNRRTNGVYTCSIYNVSGSVWTISNVLTGLNKTDYAAPIVMNNGDIAIMTIRTLLTNGVTSNYTSVSKFV